MGRIALVLLLSCALRLRRLSPGLALGVAWFAAGLQWRPRRPQYYDLAVLAVLFATACYGGRVVRWLPRLGAVPRSSLRRTSW